MANSETHYHWFYPMLLITYGIGLYLSLMQITGFFILKKGIVDPEIPGFDFIYQLSNTISKFSPLETEPMYLGIIIVIILISLTIPLYCFIKNIERHFSGWLLALNLLLSTPTLLLIFMGTAMNMWSKNTISLFIWITLGLKLQALQRTHEISARTKKWKPNYKMKKRG